MKISDILVEKTPHLSFEVFPPKTDAAYEGVLKATEAIAELKPSYMSVTYGAGGAKFLNNFVTCVLTIIVNHSDIHLTSLLQAAKDNKH